MAYQLGKRSKDNLSGVHLDLLRVVQLAITKTEQDFTVVEGLRTFDRQTALVAQGASKTMNSKHLPQKDGMSHAVDIYPYYKSEQYPNGSVHVNAPPERWGKIAEAMKAAAAELGVKITWGGDWKSFVDMPHYQIEV